MARMRRSVAIENECSKAMAYAVFCPPGAKFDYMIFADIEDAYDEIDKNLQEGDPEPEVIPLYPREK